MDFSDTDACTLPTAERPLRLAEFEGLFADHLVATTWAGHRLRLTLTGSAGLRERVLDLTARETACCSFFDFGVSGLDEELTLEVGVPSAQQPVLAGLAALAERARA